MTDNVVHLKAGPEERRKPAIELLMSVDRGETDFYFVTPQLEQLLAALQKTVETAGEVALVCGTTGSGRTALLRRFVKQFGLAWDLCVLQPRHVIGEKHLIESVSASFFRRQKVTAEELMKQFIEAGELLKAPVILIDDAQNLSSFALDILLALKCRLEKYGVHLSIVLFADDTIHATLSTPSLIKYDTLVRRFDMPIMTEQQAWDYLHHWLEVHGLDDDRFKLNVTHVHSIYHRGRGLPERMNYLIARKIEQRYSNHRFMQFRNWLTRPQGIVIASLSMFAVLILAAVFSRGTDSTVSGPLSGPPALSDTLSEIARMEQGDNATAKSDETDINGNDSVDTGDKSPSDASKQAPPAGVVKRAAGTTAAKPAAEKKAASADKPAEAATTAKPAPTAEPVHQAETKSVPVVATAAQSEAKPASNAVANAEDSGPRAVPALGNDWLMKQKPGDYTIQLAASDSESAIRNFISRQPAMQDLYYVRVSRRGSDWFVVVLGAFNRVVDARDKVDQLSSSLRKNSPWVRRISAIQKLVPVAAAGEETTVNKPEAEPTVETVTTPVSGESASIPDNDPSQAEPEPVAQTPPLPATADPQQDPGDGR